MKPKLTPYIKCKKCGSESDIWATSLFELLGITFKAFWYQCSGCNFRFAKNYQIIERNEIRKEKKCSI
jgi:hypothetical protein